MAGFQMPGPRAGLALALLVTPVAPSSVDRMRLDDTSSVARPGYLIPVADPGLGSVVMRITNDPGVATAPVPGTWGSDARHVYSKQQPWNSDQTLLTIENRSGGSPTPLILDGTTYAPRYGPCANYELWDYRWHPSRAHPHEQINVNRAGTELMWFDVTTCTKTRSRTLPIAVDYGIGSGEGNPSNDGRFVALGNNTDMFVVDMDPEPPLAPYPNRRIGPVYHFPPESLTAGNPDSWTIGNLSISPSGAYVDVKFASGGDDTTADLHRIFEVDPRTLALRPHNMASGSLRCGSFQSRPNGWIYPLKHADMALDPFDGNEDVIVGGRACPGSSLANVVMVQLRDGLVIPLGRGGEAPVYHVSTRNLDRPGWAYVSFYRVGGKRYSDEIVAFKLDGSGAAEPWCRIRGQASGCYRCEAHPVPSPDGQRVLFVSNWVWDCGAGCGSIRVIADFVTWRPGGDAVVPPHDRSGGRSATAESDTTGQSR